MRLNSVHVKFLRLFDTNIYDMQLFFVYRYFSNYCLIKGLATIFVINTRLIMLLGKRFTKEIEDSSKQLFNAISSQLETWRI